MSILFAAAHPERVSALILGFRRRPVVPGRRTTRAVSQPEEMYRALHEIAVHRWGQGDSIEWYLPSQSGLGPRPRAVRAVRAHGRSARARSCSMIAMIREIDVRERAARDPRADAGHPAAR